MKKEDKYESCCGSNSSEHIANRVKVQIRDEVQDILSKIEIVNSAYGPHLCPHSVHYNLTSVIPALFESGGKFEITKIER